MAESPPPTTTIGLSWKKKPSQVAQVDTPKPRRRLSLGRSSQRAVAPVEMMTVLARYSSSSIHTPKGREERSTRAHVGGHQRGAEALGLGAHVLHQLRALDPLREARVVLDVRGEHELAARAEALDHQRRQVGARGVDGRGVAGGAAADDDHLVQVRQGALLLGPTHTPGV